MKTKVIIIPGNYETNVDTDNWYKWVKNRLDQKGIEVIARNMPDAKLARKEYWIPFIEHELQADENTILVGHSSGAVAGMRFAETHKLKGLVLVGACYTDLGDDVEKASGYYEEEWQWDAIKDNTEWVVQFAGSDDPYIPVNESRFIHKNLSTEYYEFTDRGHFGSPGRDEVEFKELVEVISNKIS